jgi:hypothetical protein
MNGRFGGFDERHSSGRVRAHWGALGALVEKQRQLELEIKVACEITGWRSQMAIAAERTKRGRLTWAQELSIRTSADNWRDRNYIDSLEIDLETVIKQIASLTPAATTPD